MIEAPGSTYMPADEKSCWQSSLNAFEAVVVIAVCSTISATDGPISPVGLGAALPTSVAAGVALDASDENAAADNSRQGRS